MDDLIHLQSEEQELPDLPSPPSNKVVFSLQGNLNQLGRAIFLNHQLGFKWFGSSIIINILLWFWVLWQAILAFVVRKYLTDEGKIGTPVWVMFATYGATAHTFLFLYFYYPQNQLHFRSITTMLLKTTPHAAKKYEKIMTFSVYFTIIIPLAFMIGGFVKSFSSVALYARTGDIVYYSLAPLGGAVFVIHALVEPVIQLLLSFYVAASVSLFICLVFVHRVEVENFQEKLNNETTFDFHQILADHQKIDASLEFTEKAWTLLIINGIFFGSIFVITTFLLAARLSSKKTYDQVTPIGMLALNITVAFAYILALAFVNEPSNISGMLYRFVRSNQLESKGENTAGSEPSKDFLFQVDFLETYFKRNEVSISPLKVTVTYKVIISIGFMVFDVFLTLMLSSMRLE